MPCVGSPALHAGDRHANRLALLKMTKEIRTANKTIAVETNEKREKSKTCARKSDSHSVSAMTPLSPFGLVALCLVPLHANTLYGHRPWCLPESVKEKE